MVGKQSFWAIRKPKGWGVKKQGTEQLRTVHEDQQDAWQEARRLTAGKSEKDMPAGGESGTGLLARILRARVKPSHLR